MKDDGTRIYQVEHRLYGIPDPSATVADHPDIWEYLEAKAGRDIIPIMTGGHPWKVLVSKLRRDWNEDPLERSENIKGSILTLRIRMTPMEGK